MARSLHEGELVSVVIPAYNAAATVRETLESALAQTYRNLEILVVDDGSKDRTAKIVQAVAGSHTRVRLLRKANGGLSSARNHGVAHARGDLIALLDADDLWHPSKIARQVAALQRGGPGVGLVYCFHRLIDAAGRVCAADFSWRYEGDVYVALVLSTFFAPGSTALIRKACLEAVGGFDEGLRHGYEDLAACLALAERHDFAVVPEFLAGYRQMPGTMSRDVGAMKRAYNRVIAQARREHPELPVRVLRWSESSVCWYLARQGWRSGRVSPALVLLLRAILRDPASLRTLAYGRVLRRVARRWRGALSAGPIPASDRDDALFGALPTNSRQGEDAWSPTPLEFRRREFVRACRIRRPAPYTGLAAAGLVSVIVPAFNAEATLRETVELALAQSYRDLEVLVVDDGSRDRTASIAADLARRDPRVRLLQKQNGGPASARNLGLTHARGALVAPLDADDLWHPDKIARQVATLRRSGKGCALVYTWTALLDRRGRFLGRYVTSCHAGRVHSLLLMDNFVATASTPLMKRACVLKVGGFDEDLQGRCEDLMLFLSLAERYDFAVVPELFTGYRAQNDGMSHDLGAMRQGYDRIIDAARLRHPDLPHRLFRWSESRFCLQQVTKCLARRRFVPAGAALLRAGWHDPSFLLTLPLGRKFKQMMPGAGDRLRGQPFLPPCRDLASFEPPGTSWLENRRRARAAAIGTEAVAARDSPRAVGGRRFAPPDLAETGTDLL